MIPIELASLIGGAASGFLFKYLSIKAQDEKDKFDRLMMAIDKSDQSANLASQRVPNDKAGNWIRRLIIISILFGCILAPFVLALLDKPVIVEVIAPVRTWLFGLITTGGDSRFYQLPSYLLSKEMLSSLIAIISFYFGSSVAKRD